MNQGLYNAVSAMTAAEHKLDAVASNLANINSSGFKRRGTAMTSFDTVLRNQTQRQISMRQTIDDAQGTLLATDNPLDLALVGQGYFAVEGPRGEMYTRDGRFLSDSNGVLQTADGYPLAWAGARGTIDPTGVPVIVDTEGQVTQGDQKIGRLRVVDFRDHGRLEVAGGGFFLAPRGLPEATSTAQVHAGHLEQANTSGIDEMVELIAVQRGFESAAKVLTMIDQSYRRLTTPS